MKNLILLIASLIPVISFTQISQFQGPKISLTKIGETAKIQLAPFKGTVLWQKKTKKGLQWIDLPNATKDNLNVSYREIENDSIAYYRALITSQECGPSISDSFAVGILNPNLEIKASYFAQNHVHTETDTFFKPVSELDMLFKTQLISTDKGFSPNAKIILKLNGKEKTIYLKGPIKLPQSFNPTLGQVEHKMENSYTALIDSEWTKPGLTITLEAGNAKQQFNNLDFSAPNVVEMTMFDIHYFKETPGDYPAGWQNELEAKWPTAKLNLQRIPKIIFEELTIPPRSDVKAPAARVSSKEDYKTLTGLNFDGEQAAALHWKGALSRAAGRSGKVKLHYVNIYGVHAGGQAGGYGGVGNGNSMGILNHELGHALSLPHSGNNTSHPYRDTMYGIQPPAVYKNVHIGPIWAFDLPTLTFIPPTVQNNAVGGTPGTYKKSPMQGGGTGDQEKGFLMRHFSDYEVHKMNSYMENVVVKWNDKIKSYAKWDSNTKEYSKPVTNNGVQYPIERDIDVLSLMTGVSSVTEQASIVYPPIGPYKTGIIKLFDPSSAKDRAEADQVFCPNNGCDFSLRVTQGGKVKTYMIPIEIDLTADPIRGGYKTEAINLKANDGTITKIELLETPDAEKNGMPANDKIIRTWTK